MHLVLVHAFPLGPQMWQGLIPYLAPSIDVITPALPGFAGTPVSNQSPDLAVFAQSLLEQIDGEFVIGGCSMGGYVVMEMMRQAPERIAGVLLMDTKAEADGEPARARRLEIAAGVESGGMAPWVITLFAPLLGQTTRSENPALATEVRQVIEGANPHAVAWAQRAMAVRQDSRGTLTNWHKPALVIVGQEDELSPVAMANQMAELLPQGELAIIDAAGHLAAWERPGDVAEVIASWWASSYPPAG